ncbi:hypothetical protein E2C01_044916 [Portunus trituberculatus]|uniref:Uncharacterized protein n=1 Tax=Portunus trituberculatus TaxID=210409 RepID=A0A5B7G0Q8_PORTR|nr:hypothetical protein [Portunus trituberculatus]
MRYRVYGRGLTSSLAAAHETGRPLGVDRPQPHHPPEAYDYDDYDAYSHYEDKSYMDSYDYGGSYDLYNGLSYTDFPDYVYDEFDDYNTSDGETTSMTGTTDRYPSSSSSTSSPSSSSSSLSSSSSSSSSKEEEGKMKEEGEEEDEEEQEEKETKTESEIEISEEADSRGTKEEARGGSKNSRSDHSHEEEEEEEETDAEGGERDHAEMEHQQSVPEAMDGAEINPDMDDMTKMEMGSMEMNDARLPTQMEKVGMAVDTWRATDDEDLLEGSGASHHDKIYGEWPPF